MKAFLAHSFAPADSTVVNAVNDELLSAGWTVLTGAAAAPRSVSMKVRARITGAQLFVGIFTRRHRIDADRWTTSPWVIEEKAYSLGSNASRPLILLVEHGIEIPAETGGLIGDLEYIPFDRYRLDAAVRSLRTMLTSIAAEIE